MPNLDQFVFGTFALIGLVNLVQFALDKNWQSFIKGMVAVMAGTLFGLFHWFGIPSAEIGFVLGISSSGVYKGLQVLSGK